MFTKQRLKIRNFIKDHKKIIIIVIVIWLIIIIINFLLGLRKEPIVLNTSYTPHESVLDSDVVPEKDSVKISDMIDKYIGYCNNGEYEKAFNMISTNCKEKAFNNDVEKYKEYVTKIFTQFKRYSIQDYKNYDNTYIYTVRIFNDFIKTGLTGEKFATFEEKFAMVKEGNEIKLNVGDFIDKVELKRVVEDDYSKIRIMSKAVFYDYEEYEVKITNKTDYIMVLSSVYEGEEVLLDLGNIRREMTNDSLEIALAPGETRTYKISFSKYVDEKENPQAFVFNKIRILKAYSGVEENAEKEKKNAVKLYSLTIPLT